MSLQKKIDVICEGKTIRVFSVKEDRNIASFVESFRNCGKKSCTRCKDKSKKPHGPYWTLNYLDENGKSRSLYVGKSLPQIAENHKLVSFADLVSLYQERHRNQESIERYKEEIKKLRLDMARMFREISRLQREYIYQGAGARNGNGNSNGKAEKVFRQLAVKYHPDRNSHRSFSAEDVMKDINQLYQQMLKQT